MEAQCLVPVPLFRWRQIGRGYNQADVIARQIRHRLGLPIDRSLIRVKNTVTQTEVHSQQNRLENATKIAGAVQPCIHQVVRSNEPDANQSTSGVIAGCCSASARLLAVFASAVPPIVDCRTQLDRHPRERLYHRTERSTLLVQLGDALLNVMR